MYINKVDILSCHNFVAIEQNQSILYYMSPGYIRLHWYVLPTIKASLAGWSVP